jgi:hypothetical protein
LSLTGKRKTKKKTKAKIIIPVVDVKIPYQRGKSKCELSPHFELIKNKMIGSGFTTPIREILDDLRSLGETTINRQDLHGFREKLKRIYGDPESYVLRHVEEFEPERLIEVEDISGSPLEVLEEVKKRTYKTLNELKEVDGLPEDVKSLIGSVEKRMRSVFIQSAEMYEQIDVIEMRTWILRTMQQRIAARMELEATLGITFKDVGEDLDRMNKALSELKKDKQDMGIFPRSQPTLPDGATLNFQQNNLNLNVTNPERQARIYAYVKQFEENTRSISQMLAEQT